MKTLYESIMDISGEKIDSYISTTNYISQYVYRLDKMSFTDSQVQGTALTEDDYIIHSDGSVSFFTGILLRDKRYFGKRKPGIKIPPPPFKIREVSGGFVCDPLEEYINLPESVHACLMVLDKAKLSNIKMEIRGKSQHDPDVIFYGTISSASNIELKYTGVKPVLFPGGNIGGARHRDFPCVQFTGIHERIMKGFTFKLFSFVMGLTKSGKNLDNELYNKIYNQYKDVVVIQKYNDALDGTWLYNNGNEFELKHY